MAPGPPKNWGISFQRRGATCMGYLDFMMVPHGVIHLTIAIKGKVILFVPSFLQWHVHCSETATHKETPTNLHPFPWTFKRNYKLKHNNILWTALWFSSARNQHLYFSNGQFTTKFFRSPCFQVQGCTFRAEASVNSSLCSGTNWHRNLLNQICYSQRPCHFTRLYRVREQQRDWKKFSPKLHLLTRPQHSQLHTELMYFPDPVSRIFTPNHFRMRALTLYT